MKYEEIIITPSKSAGKYWQIKENTQMKQKGIIRGVIDIDIFFIFFFVGGHIENTYYGVGEWIFRIGETFTPVTLGLEMICQLPKRWILDCRSTSKTVLLQMIHEFNVNGYIYTERELNSGKNYKMIMKKTNKISHYERKERDNNLMQIAQMSLPVKETIEERANNKTKNLDSTQEKTNAVNKLYLLGSIMMIFLAILMVILLGYGLNPKKIDTTGVLV